jgi:hypothetical protein
MGGTCNTQTASDGTACNTGDFCSINDHCQAGACVSGGTMICPGPAPNVCSVPFCDSVNRICSFAPGNDGAACTDGDVCNAGKVCNAGLCTGGMPANDGKSCTSPFSCVSGSTCTNGTCSGLGPLIYFAEPFNDNSKGWTLDLEWAIGPTMASVCQSTNGPDPIMDHTGTPFSGVAGVVLGGCPNVFTPHPYSYLTSPAFDTSKANGHVIFGYWRWLNSDSDPMHNSVEVFDGTQWVTLWTTGGPPSIADSAWTYQSFDVTAQKNANMRVRFGFDITGQPPYVVSSWNVDDILVASAACP